MKDLSFFNLNLKEIEHPLIVESLHVLNGFNKNFFQNRLNFNNELTLSVESMEKDHVARYNHRYKIITLNDRLPIHKVEYALFHELGHYYDQKLNDLLFQGTSLHYQGHFASDKIKNILDYGKKTSNWSDWHQSYVNREEINTSSLHWVERVYDLLNILELVSEKFILGVGLDSWKEKGLVNLNFLSKWINGVKRFNVDQDLAKEGWEKWKLSTMSSFSFIPMMDKEKKEQLEYWRYSWNQFIQSIEDLLFPSVSNKDYLQWHTTWTALIKALENNGLEYETRSSELWANGFANFLSTEYTLNNNHFLNLLPVGKDKIKHNAFWRSMIEFIVSSFKMVDKVKE